MVSVSQVHQVKFPEGTRALKRVSASARYPQRLEVLRHHRHLAQAMVLRRLQELLLVPPPQPLAVSPIDPKKPALGLLIRVSPIRHSIETLKDSMAASATILP